MTVLVNEIVLYVSDLERSRSFYSAVGLQLSPVRLGSANDHPHHYEAILGSEPLFLQLFPAGTQLPTRTRLRFEVPDIRDIAERMKEAGFNFRIKNEHQLHATDPDGTGIYAMTRRR